LSGAQRPIPAYGTDARTVTGEGLDCLRATATAVAFGVSQVRLRTTVERIRGVRNVPSWLFEWFSLTSSLLLLCVSLTWSYHTLKDLSAIEGKSRKAHRPHTRGSAKGVKHQPPTAWDRLARALHISASTPG
jgi:hypothetical protein